jgi:hypothetical protein
MTFKWSINDNLLPLLVCRSIDLGRRFGQRCPVPDLHSAIPAPRRETAAARTEGDAVNGLARSTLGPEVLFGVHVRNDNRDGIPPLLMLKATCGPGDEGEPVVTVMVPDED